MIKYPIVIFSYNRPTHLENLLISLKIILIFQIIKYFFFAMVLKMKKTKKNKIN